MSANSFIAAQTTIISICYIYLPLLVTKDAINTPFAFERGWLKVKTMKSWATS